MNDLKNKFRACLLGGGAGDALGYAVEFDSWSRIRSLYGDRGITSMVAHDYAPLGGISDDTQMTLFTAEGLLRAYTRLMVKGITTVEGVTEYAYLRWLHTQGRDIPLEHLNGWLITHRELFARRAPGNTCLNALDHLSSQKFHNGPNPPRNDSKGCGTVMRLAPVALMGVAHEWSLPHAAQVAVDLAEITHHHRTSSVASAAMVIMIMRLLQGASKRQARDDMLAFAATLEGSDEFMTCFEQLQPALDAGDDTPQVIDEMLGYGGWVAEDAFLIAVYAFLKADNFDEILRIAVNHSGDADSTGAIGGNLAGAFYGLDAIDAGQWVRDLELGDVIDEMAVDLFESPEWESSEPWGVPEELWRKYPGH